MSRAGCAGEIDKNEPCPADRSSAALQASYHHERFSHLNEPAAIADLIEDLSGSLDPQAWLGLDQMGHFGPHGCALAVERIIGRVPTDSTVIELGSGYGGALRDIVDRLACSGFRPRRAIGIDIVLDHCRAAQVISTDMTRSPTLFTVADATALALAGGVADIVIVIGSMPHFARPDLVLHEAARLLRPHGHLILFEEVSLVTDESVELSTAFIATHPDDVFHRSTPSERLADMDRAGFGEVTVEDLGSWGLDLLRARLQALSLLRGTAETVYGRPEVDLIERTLAAAIIEFGSGRILPRLIVATKRP